MRTYRSLAGYIVPVIFMQCLAWTALIFAGAYDEGTLHVRFLGEAAMLVVRLLQFPLITTTSMDGFLLKYAIDIILYTIVVVTGVHSWREIRKEASPAGV
jgi:hypothetical protein